MVGQSAKVYWLTGLSGAGKTTIGKALYARLRETDPATVLLDGDTLREVFGGVYGYEPEERRKCAMSYGRLCRLLAQQGITVVCCTISMFHSVREWNRENIQGYTEVYIKASAETLRRRDQKGLYSGVEAGSARNVMGMDMACELPRTPDVTIENDGNLTPEECAEMILEEDG